MQRSENFRKNAVVAILEKICLMKIDGKLRADDCSRDGIGCSTLD